MSQVISGTTYYLYPRSGPYVSVSGTALTLLPSTTVTLYGDETTSTALSVRDTTGTSWTPQTDAQGMLPAFLAPQVDDVFVDAGAGRQPIRCSELAEVIASLTDKVGTVPTGYTDIGAAVAAKAAASDLAGYTDPTELSSAISTHAGGYHQNHPVVVVEDATNGWGTSRPSTIMVIGVPLSSSSTLPSWWQHPDIVVTPQSVVAPTFLYQATFEGHTNGATITTDAVSGSGDALDVIQVPANTSLTASTTSPYGTIAAKFSILPGATGQQVWATAGRSSMGEVTEQVVGGSYKIPALPTASTFAAPSNCIVLRVRNTTDTAAPARASLRITPTGTVQLLNASGTTVGTTSLSVTAGENVWLELWFKYASSTSYCQARVTKADGTTSETLGSLVSGGSYGTSINSAEFGIMTNGVIASNGSAFSVYVGEVRRKKNDWVRPA